jgi:hypothetical protein
MGSTRVLPPIKTVNCNVINMLVSCIHNIFEALAASFLSTFPIRGAHTTLLVLSVLCRKTMDKRCMGEKTNPAIVSGNDVS